MSVQQCSPLLADITLCGRKATEVSTAIEVNASEPVFAGHYPGFPIFPGVCLVEFAHLSAKAALPSGVECLELQAVDNARFRSPVFPGERLSAELSWRQQSDGWRCAVALSTERGKAAQVSLSFSSGRQQ